MDGDEADEAMELSAQYIPPEEEPPVDDTPDVPEEKDTIQYRHGSFMEQTEAAQSPVIARMNAILKTDLVDIRIPVQK